jgi:hypothetical protein
MKILKKWYDTARDYGLVSCRIVLNEEDEIIEEFENIFFTVHFLLDNYSQ